MTYEVVARNFSEASENRIHSDEIAKKYGFKGALVPGVAVYGHLTYPLVASLGETWLGGSVGTVRLMKPAYHGDKLLVALASEGTHHTVTCHNADGELLAELKSELPDELPDELPEPHDLASFGTAYKHPERVVISWENVVPGQPFAPWEVTVTEEINAKYTDEVADVLPLYQQGYAHPHFLQSIANTALTNEYTMPTWMHVGTETRHRAAVRVGDTLTVKSATLERWERKGHEFIKAYVSLWRGDELTTDMLHTAIFKVAD